MSIMCLCMYACTYVCMYVCMYVCRFVGMNTTPCIHTSVSLSLSRSHNFQRSTYVNTCMTDDGPSQRPLWKGQPLLLSVVRHPLSEQHKQYYEHVHSVLSRQYLLAHVGHDFVTAVMVAVTATTILMPQ